MSWQAFEDGKTMGRTGSEGGVIRLDDEHLDGARITLEAGCLRAPYAITCGIYGWMVHTRFLADEETADHAVTVMKPALEDILVLLPGADDDAAARAGAVEDAIAAFVESYP